MIILTTSIGYGPGELSIFWDSLKKTGFSGEVVVVSNDCKPLEERGATIIEYPYKDWTINFGRWGVYSNFLKGVKEPVVITDIRDVVFQKNPEEYMPLDGVNVFEEDANKTIGTCWFNKHWMDLIGTDKWNDKPIICAGVTSGVLDEYSRAMWEAMQHYKPLNSRKEYQGGDQAIHNDLIYSGFPAKIHKNEQAEVYTVGHLPLESVKTNNGLILNKAGEVPCMVHMYDRHVNLIVSIIQRLQLEVRLNIKG